MENNKPQNETTKQGVSKGKNPIVKDLEIIERMTFTGGTEFTRAPSIKKRIEKK